jgi:hypothetical protein
VILVDVYGLGVKNAFWREGSRADLEDMIQQLAKHQKMVATAPAGLAENPARRDRLTERCIEK